MKKTGYDPSIFSCSTSPRAPERIAFVFQGGGALGAFQVGVIEALQDNHYCPDIVSGISIGAINAAIMAGNHKEDRLKKLEAFWCKIATHSPLDFLKGNDWAYRMYNAIGAYSSILFGQPGFFRPKMMNPFFTRGLGVDEISFYDISPLRDTLLELIDFELINSKQTRLFLGAVCLETGELTYFNNDDDIITPEHIMASAALPPGFPAIKISDKFYWDGAVYSNTPLTAVLDAQPERNTLCFAINCFTASGDLPDTLDGIRQREKDIRYSSHLKECIDLYTERQNFRCAIAHLSKKLGAEAQKEPEIQQLLNLGSPKLVQIVQLNYKTTRADHYSKDFNFALKTLEAHRRNGYATALKALRHKPWEQIPESYIGAQVYEETTCELPQKDTDHETPT